MATADPRGLSARRRPGLAVAVGMSLLLFGCEDPVTPVVGSGGFVMVTPNLQTMHVGETVGVSATGFAKDGGMYALGSVSWSSSNESIATVASSTTSIFGNQATATVLGVGVGIASIRANTERAGAGSVTVTVTATAPSSRVGRPPKS